MTQVAVSIPDDLEDREPAELLELIGRVQRARYNLAEEERRLQRSLDYQEVDDDGA